MFELLGAVLGIFVLAITVLLAICLMLISSGFAALIGAGFAIANYFQAAADNINLRTWTWDHDDEPARRSYYFGPGYVQMIETAKDAFDNNAETAQLFHTITKPYRIRIDFWEIGTYFAVCAYAADFCGTIFVHCAGAVVTLIFVSIHFLITAIVMIIVYIVFSIIWLADRGYLVMKRISSICPGCKHRCTVPFFICSCGAVHKRLVPGPYGILKHRCICGKKTPATFFNGRSKLAAVCPKCGKVLVSSNSRPLVVQLIGGTGVGKTVFLSAYYHLLKEKLNSLNSLEWSVPEDYRPYFNELDMYFSGEASSVTTFMNSQLYPIIIHNSSGTDRQISLFDISGEMFDGVTSKSVAQQMQFHYCDGFVFLIDPFCRDSQLKRPKQENTFFSEMDMESVVTSFLNYLIETGKRNASVRSSTPVAVVIGKCDVKGVRECLSKERILEQTQSLENRDWTTLRDSVCRHFLVDIGFSNAIGNLEASFSNIHYFPISAMGHSQNDEKYEPWGVMEPVDWIVSEADKELAYTLGISIPG